jgi:hypothetical protein
MQTLLANPTDHVITSADGNSSRTSPRRPRLAGRMIAIVMADRFDKLLAAGVTPKPGSAMAAHAQRLASPSERDQLANTLRTIAGDARTIARIHRVPVHPSRVEAARDLLDQIVSNLHRPTALKVAGVARLRMLLRHAAGPFYRCGSGDLRAELHAVLTAM